MTRPAWRAAVARLPHRSSLAALAGLAAALAVAAAGCGSAAPKAAPETAPPGGLAQGLATLPDRPEIRRNVYFVDVDQLRRAYPGTNGLRRSLLGAWFPDAAVGVVSPAWRRAFGFGLADLASVTAAGYHPASVMVAKGAFAPGAIRSALEARGCHTVGARTVCLADGKFDASTPTGRLVLSAVNRVGASRSRLITASTAALERAAESPRRTLGDDGGLASLAAALDPVTSAVILDVDLVRPPAGMPVAVIPNFSARRIAVALDDDGPAQRTLKIGLLYDTTDDARADADRLRPRIATAKLVTAGLGDTFGDLASDWKVEAVDRTVLITASLAPDADRGVWRYLTETGDLATLIRPSLESR